MVSKATVEGFGTEKLGAGSSGMKSQLSGNDARWRAVMQRDRTADGQFVFAVRTTNIYCKPSCAARRPKRANLIFFPDAHTASRAGFRACRRCRPDEATLLDPHAEAVASVCRRIDTQISDNPEENTGGNGSELQGLKPLNTNRLISQLKLRPPEIVSENGPGLKLRELANSVGLSTHQLERAFRRVLGISPKKYADAQRMRRVKAALKGGDDVTTAIYEAGFGSSSRLYERAAGQLGMTPATYGRGGAGMKIGYTIAESPLGRLLVAATEHGISAVYLAKDDKALETALREEYPRAEIVHGGNQLKHWVTTILEHLRGREPNLDLPTDVQATAFQRRVWEELRKIPYGTTRTYTQVARAIGKPAAIRAVARACATNPTSIVVPCHRVVREDGKLAGYRWGIERKESLLAREKELAERKADR
jgi:AraC family transcriptional regulator, regulatory protein of adaptative response / methylated-DNA-[protein]-cysteine methyltransferase